MTDAARPGSARAIEADRAVARPARPGAPRPRSASARSSGGSSSSSASLYFFLPLLGDVRVLAAGRARSVSAYTERPRRPAVLSRASSTRSSSGSSRSSSASLLIVPTAFWVRLRVPRAAPVRRVHHAAAVRHPAGRPRVRPDPHVQPAAAAAHRHGPRQQRRCSSAAYVVLSFPYMYRAVDTGLRAIDIRIADRGGPEPRRRLAHGSSSRVILPNLRVALLSGAFLTLAIVIGEFTIATFLARPAFGPYLSLLGGNQAYEPAAVSLISFGLTWIAMGVIAFLGRGSRHARSRSPAPADGDEDVAMTFLDLTGVQKQFGDVVAVERLQPRRREGRVRLVPRAVGLRQDDDAADDRRLRAADRRHDHDRRRRTSPTGRRTSATSAWSSSRTRCSRT